MIAAALGHAAAVALVTDDALAAPNDPTKCDGVTYCGGPVISNVQVVPVFWTNEVRPSITAWAPNYLARLVDSPFVDMLSEYSTTGQSGVVCGMMQNGAMTYFGPSTTRSSEQTITRGTTVAPAQIQPRIATGILLDDDDAVIGKEIVAQIGAGGLPPPSYDAHGYPNTLYVVFLPSSYHITLQGLGSCGAFAAYHKSVRFDAQLSCAGHYLPYAVVADCNDSIDQLSSYVSHEIAESITDPDIGPSGDNPRLGDGAWYIGPSYPCKDSTSCPYACGEIGDVCEVEGTATLPGIGITAQKVWSQSQRNCKTENTAFVAQPTPAPLAQTCAVDLPIDAGAPTPTVVDAGASADASRPLEPDETIAASSVMRGARISTSDIRVESTDVSAGGGCAIAARDDASRCAGWIAVALGALIVRARRRASR